MGRIEQTSPFTDEKSGANEEKLGAYWVNQQGSL